MLVFVAVGSEQERTVDGAVDGDFAFSAAADGTDFFAFGGAEAIGFSFAADRAEHSKQNTRGRDKCKINRSRRGGLRFYVLGTEAQADDAGWDASKDRDGAEHTQRKGDF